ncbi:CatB-related O-acetyltransferase [Microbulbifer variabilis]|uniref:CatB-related O-acetyltransferase n=1 Tax=Microbulbifer TaxID=48073 RepID=UPI00256F484F|nr:CatB-related O-acetyltransferase [Microbulbifer variabilis]
MHAINSLLFDKLALFLSELPNIPENYSTYIDSLDCEYINIKSPKALKNAFFEESVRLNALVLTGQFRSFIGAHSYIGEGGYLKQCFIGRYCSIGRRVTIGAGSHSMKNLTTYPGLSKKTPTSPVILENDIWVGDGAIILPGIRIGTGAVIGANAVVTKDVSNFSVVAGSPARHIKYRIDSSLFSSVLDSLWWEYSKDILLETKDLELQDRLMVLNALNKNNFKNYDTYHIS